MSNQNKNKLSNFEIARNVASHIGIFLMSAAATFGMLEMPDHGRAQIVVPSRAIFAFAGESNTPEPANANSIRRERDDVETHYVSYSETQRTPSRSGAR